MTKEQLQKASFLQFRIKQLVCLKEYLIALFEGYPLSVNIEFTGFGNKVHNIVPVTVSPRIQDSFMGMEGDGYCAIEAIDKRIKELEIEFEKL